MTGSKKTMNVHSIVVWILIMFLVKFDVVKLSILKLEEISCRGVKIKIELAEKSRFWTSWYHISIMVMVLCFLGPFWLLTKLGFKEGLLALFGGGGRERFYRHARGLKIGGSGNIH